MVITALATGPLTARALAESAAGVAGAFDPGEGKGLGEAFEFGANVGVAEQFGCACVEEEEILEQKGLHGFGQGADMSSFAPTAHLTAIEDIWPTGATRPCRRRALTCSSIGSVQPAAKASAAFRFDNGQSVSEDL